MEVDKSRIAELVAKIQGGDDSAFNELYELTSKPAYFIALEFTKNEQDAEDILQESYIKALSKINEIDKPESFISWFNQIVANKSKDHLKSKKPLLFEEEESEGFEFIPDEDTDFRPEGSLDQTELQKTVMEVLDELKEEKRACIMMMYYQELSVGEIAESLEIPEGTVKTRLFSARKDLKEMFAKRGITSLYSVSPMGVVIWAMQRTSEGIQKSFSESPAYAKVMTGVLTASAGGTVAGVAATGGSAAIATASAVETGTAVGTGVTAGAAATAAAGASSVAASAAVTGTGVAARIAAMTAVQKIVAGASIVAVISGSTAGVVSVVNNNGKSDEISTTAYTEEYTTAPCVEITFAVPAMGTAVFSDTTVSSAAETSSLKIIASKQTSTSTKNSSSAITTAYPGKTTLKSTTKTTTKRLTESKTSATTQASATTTKNTTTAKASTTENTNTTVKSTTTTRETTVNHYTTLKQPIEEPKQESTTTHEVAYVIIEVVNMGGETVDTLKKEIEPGKLYSINEAYEDVVAEGYDPEGGISGAGTGSSGAISGESYYFKASL